MSDQQLSLDMARRFPDLQWHIEVGFFKYHDAHPDIYPLFKRFAYDVRRRGARKYGSKAIMERIRWHMEVDTAAGEFKINNNYASCYGRLLIEEDPSLKDFIETRRTPGTVETH